MSLRERAVKGAAWSALQNWGGSLLAIVIFTILARLLTREDFGLLALATGCVTVAEILMKQGMGQALVQRQDLCREHLDTAFWTSVVVGCALALLTVVSSGFVSGAFAEPRLASLLRWLSLYFIMAGLANTQIAVLTREFQFKSLALRQLVAVTAGGAVGIGMALGGMGVWSLVGQLLAMNAVGAVMLWTASDWRPGMRVSVRRFRELFGFGAGVMGVDGLTIINTRGPDLLVGYFLGAQLLGLYNAASQILALLVRMLMQSVSAVALPTFSRIQHDLEQTRNAYLTAVQASCLVAFPVFAGLGVLAPDIVVIALGAKWEASVPVVRVFAIVGMMQALMHYNRPVLLASGRPGWVLKVTAASVPVNLVAIAVACRWGITAAAWAYAGCFLAFAPLWLVLVRRAISLPGRAILGQTLIPLAGCVVMVCAVTAARALLIGRVDPRVALAVSIAAGAVVYPAAVTLMAPAVTAKVRELAALAMGRGPRESGG